MAIKIDWQDLQKRYVGWQEVVKVMLDGGEIRPNEVPPIPQPVYHVMSDFASSGSSGSLPRWWSIQSGLNYIIDSEGVSVSSNGVVTIEKSNLPSLKNASKIKIEHSFKIKEGQFYNLRLNEILSSSTGQRAPLMTEVLTWQINWWDLSSTTPSYSLSPWEYILSEEYDFNNLNGTIELSTQNGVIVTSDTVTYGASAISYIRDASEYNIWVYPWLVLHSTDFYVRYNEESWYVYSENGPTLYATDNRAYYQLLITVQASGSVSLVHNRGYQILTNISHNQYGYHIRAQWPVGAWESWWSGRPREMSVVLDSDSSVYTTFSVDINNPDIED